MREEWKGWEIGIEVEGMEVQHFSKYTFLYNFDFRTVLTFCILKKQKEKMRGKQNDI